MTTPSRELKRRARCVLEGKYFFASNAACSLMLYSFTAAIILQYTGLGTSEKPVGIDQNKGIRLVFIGIKKHGNHRLLFLAA